MATSQARFRLSPGRTLVLLFSIAVLLAACSTPTTPPTNLTATPGARPVELTWTASTNATAAYQVLQGLTSTSLEVVADLPAGTTSHTATVPYGFQTYYFAVQVVGATESPLRTPVVSATPYQTGFPDSQFLVLDGNSANYLRIAHHSDLNPATELTIEGRLRKFSHSGFEDCPGIIGKGWQSAYWVGICTNTIRSYVRNAVAYTSGAVTLDEWVHFAITSDGVNTRDYINGALVGTNAVAGSPTANTHPLRIGRDVNWNETPIGALSNLRIWNVARTEAEIAENMGSTFRAAEPGLVAEWSLKIDGRQPIGDHTAELVGAPGFGIEGTLTEDDPTFPVVYIDGVAGTCGDQGTFPVPYKVHQFYVETAGNYTLSTRDFVVGAGASLYVFEGAFDPENPTPNCVAAMNGSTVNLKVATAALPVGGPHTVVVIDD